MNTYNTVATVVDLIDADSAEGAVSQLQERLRSAGFDVYEGYPPGYEQAYPIERREAE